MAYLKNCSMPPSRGLKMPRGSIGPSLEQKAWSTPWLYHLAATLNNNDQIGFLRKWDNEISYALYQVQNGKFFKKSWLALLNNTSQCSLKLTLKNSKNGSFKFYGHNFTL